MVSTVRPSDVRRAVGSADRHGRRSELRVRAIRAETASKRVLDPHLAARDVEMIDHDGRPGRQRIGLEERAPSEDRRSRERQRGRARLPESLDIFGRGSHADGEGAHETVGLRRVPRALVRAVGCRGGRRHVRLAHAEDGPNTCRGRQRAGPRRAGCGCRTAGTGCNEKRAGQDRRPQRDPGTTRGPSSTHWGDRTTVQRPGVAICPKRIRHDRGLPIISL